MSEAVKSMPFSVFAVIEDTVRLPDSFADLYGALLRPGPESQPWLDGGVFGSATASVGAAAWGPGTNLTALEKRVIQVETKLTRLEQRVAELEGEKVSAEEAERIKKWNKEMDSLQGRTGQAIRRLAKEVADLEKNLVPLRPHG